MNTLTRVWEALKVVVKGYPALTAILLNVGVLLAAKLGFNLSPNELLVVVGMVNVFAGAYVHSQVSPTKKLTDLGIVTDGLEVAAARIKATPSPTEVAPVATVEPPVV
jgi:hypothetical protein